MTNITVTVDELGLGSLLVDGHDVTCYGIYADIKPGERPLIRLDLLPVTSDFAFVVDNFDLTDESVALLKAMGWTPPPEVEGPC